MTIKFSVAFVKELMTPHPAMISPKSTLQEAAQKMDTVGCGALPVGTEKKLQGIITDRDIVVRAIAQGRNAARERVADYMTEEVVSCHENDTLEEAAELMHRHRVSRLVVRDGGGAVTGILSFGSVIRNDASAQEVAGLVKHAAGPVSV